MYLISIITPYIIFIRLFNALNVRLFKAIICLVVDGQIDGRERIRSTWLHSSNVHDFIVYFDLLLYIFI